MLHYITTKCKDATNIVRAQDPTQENNFKMIQIIPKRSKPGKKGPISIEGMKNNKGYI